MLDLAREVLVDRLMIHSAVSKDDRALCNFRNLRVMGDDYKCGTVHMQFAEQFHNDLFIGLVQVAGRFIGEDDLRIVDQGARDADSLLLAA